ncbi:MAG TPA: group 1 truncated hemoglobin [Myxococcaceae bacterium]|nr:group 1 truncated hemoglobin [Myxococcaceae bacterium]
MRCWSPLLALLVACASGSEATRPDARASTPSSTTSSGGGPSLYERLGRRPGIDLVMHTFVGNVGRDKRINVRFLFVDMDVLQSHLTDQVCAASGGPCAYAGREMKPLHAPMHVRGAEFDAMGEDLLAALKTQGVPERETKELLAIVASTRADIVEPEAK